MESERERVREQKPVIEIASGARDVEWPLLVLLDRTHLSLRTLHDAHLRAAWLWSAPHIAWRLHYHAGTSAPRDRLAYAHSDGGHLFCDRHAACRVRLHVLLQHPATSFDLNFTKSKTRSAPDGQRRLLHAFDLEVEDSFALCVCARVWSHFGRADKLSLALRDTDLAASGARALLVQFPPSMTPLTFAARGGETYHAEVEQESLVPSSALSEPVLHTVRKRHGGVHLSRTLHPPPNPPLSFRRTPLPFTAASLSPSCPVIEPQDRGRYCCMLCSWGAKRGTGIGKGEFVQRLSTKSNCQKITLIAKLTLKSSNSTQHAKKLPICCSKLIQKFFEVETLQGKRKMTLPSRAVLGMAGQGSRGQRRVGMGVFLTGLMAILSVEARLPKHIPRFAFDREESPVHVPLIINVLLVNLGPDAEPASFRLDTDEFERLLFQVRIEESAAQTLVVALVMIILCDNSSAKWVHSPVVRPLIIAFLRLVKAAGNLV